MADNEELTPAEEKLSDWMAENLSDDELAELEQGDDTVTTKETPTTDATEEPTTTAAGPEKGDDAQLSRQKAELDAKLERISRGKVRVYAESKLVGTARLHKTHLEDFVERTMSLKLDDTEEDKEHKTALDRHLEAEFKTRAPSVDLSETAEVPDLDGKEEDISDADEADLEMARLEEMKLEAEGSGWSDDANKLDALACKIQRELKVPYDKAMNLAHRHLSKGKSD